MIQKRLKSIKTTFHSKSIFYDEIFRKAETFENVDLNFEKYQQRDT